MKRTDDKLRSLKQRIAEYRRTEQLLVEEIMDKRAEVAEEYKELSAMLDDLRPERAEENGVLRDNGAALSPMPH